MPATNQKIVSVLLLALAAISTARAARAPAVPHQGKKDYLTDAEAEKIRDEQNPGDRIKLYLSFAEDRLKKFQYETTRTVPEAHRGDILNGLMNGYSGCLDDAADQIDEAKDKQLNIHPELKLLESKGKEFLVQLQKIEKAKGPDFDDYSDTLEDAIDGTQDAVSSAHAALKEMLPAPVRRKQN
jgi:hypothetical protein